MKAIIQNEFGNSCVLNYTNIDKPIIGEHEVLIRTAFTSVNYADIKNRTGNKTKGHFPLTLGLDMSGTVEDVNKTVLFQLETGL